MIKQLLKNQQGMALLLVISLVSILAIITLQFNREMRQEYIISAGLKNSVKLVEMATSGITIAEQILLSDLEENTFDSLHDSWALLTATDFATIFEQGSLEITIIAENGKFPINAMVILKKEGNKPKNKNEAKKQSHREIDVRNILWRLLRAEPFFVEDGKAREIIDSLIDWIDTGDGDGEEEYGAENSYYQSLNPPYSCKNGPIESIEELLLVKGINRELLYGTEDRPPLAPLLTVTEGDGKININTADALLLQAMNQNIQKDMAESMISFREDEQNKSLLKNPQWYKQVPSFPGDIADKIKQQDLTTVTSDFFTIQSTAKLNTKKNTTTATVKRTKDDIVILRWDSE